MSVLVWFLGFVVIIVSFILWFAGLMGKEGVLLIGMRAVSERKEQTKGQLRPVNAFNVVMGIAGILVGLAILLVAV
jgi:uncharacterized membrane protein